MDLHLRYIFGVYLELYLFIVKNVNKSIDETVNNFTMLEM